MGCSRRLRTSLAVVLTLAAVAGCPMPTGLGPGLIDFDGGAIGDGDGDADAGAADAGAVPLEADSYCERIAGFFCPYYLRCGRMAVDSVEACQAVFAEACEGRYEPRYVGLADEGLLTLSEEGLAACEAHLEDVACAEQIRDLDGPCAGMWVGSVPPGGACGFDVESFICAPGSTCILSLDLCGTCEPAAGTGEACGGPAGIRCLPTDECVDDVCERRPLPGEGCDPDGVRCVLGASCQDGRCIPPLVVGVGDACDASHRCPYHAFCIGGVCTLAASLGQSCTTGVVECDSGWCDDGTCAPLKEDGQPCSLATECRGGRCVDSSCAGLPSECVAP
jgi:hypothetical protein